MKYALILILIFLFSCNDNSATSKKTELGSKIYSNACASCHGSVNNLSSLKLELSQIIYSVTNGKGTMPSFKNKLNLEEIDAVSYFIYQINIDSK